MDHAGIHFLSDTICEEMSRKCWRRECQPTAVFLPVEFHGQKTLVGYSPCGHKELSTTEGVMHTHISRKCTLAKVTKKLLIFCR